MRFELAPFDLPEGYADGIVPLAAAKAHLSIEAGETDLDDLVGALRDAAVDMVERYCGVYLAERTGVVWRAEGLPWWSWVATRQGVRLPVGPVTEVTAFTYLDSRGNGQTGDASTLRVATGGEVQPKAMQFWPSDLYEGVELTFTAGYTDANRPAALVAAVKMFAANLFANREPVVTTGRIVAELPLGFRQLCDAYRAVVI